MNDRYFNFPVQLLSGFMGNTMECLSNILYYSLYEHSTKLEYNDKKSRFKESAEYYGVTLGNVKKALENGENTFNEIPERCPKVGLDTSMFWDFYKNHKTEFEKVCLLGFLAIKSILQNKAYCKITNGYWLSRMDGFSGTIEKSKLSDEVQKYYNEYQTKKIKSELRENWGLVTYSRYTRGFYVSFKLSLDDLIYQAEKVRKSTKEKQYRFAEKVAFEKAMSRINNESGQ